MKILKGLFKKYVEKDNIEEYYGHGSTKHEQMKNSHNGMGQSGNGIKKQSGNKYQCPMKCEGNKMYNTPGNCPVCNMNLMPVR